MAKTVHLKTYSGKEWEGFQRITKDSMSADRRQRLDGVDGWVWDVRSSKHARKKP